MARHRRRTSLPASSTKAPQSIPDTTSPVAAPEPPSTLPSSPETLPRWIRRDLILVALWGVGAVALLVGLAILDRLTDGSVSEILAL